MDYDIILQKMITDIINGNGTIFVAQKRTEDLFCEHLECIISMKNVSKFGMTTKTKIVVSNLIQNFWKIKNVQKCLC